MHTVIGRASPGYDYADDWAGKWLVCIHGNQCVEKVLYAAKSEPRQSSRSVSSDASGRQGAHCTMRRSGLEIGVGSLMAAVAFAAVDPGDARRGAPMLP